MSIFVPPLHRPAVYPRTTGFYCPECFENVELDRVEYVDHADHDGNPVEKFSVGFYCTNKLCEHNRQPIDEEDLQRSRPRYP